MNFKDVLDTGAIIGVALVYVLNEVRKILARRKKKRSVGIDKNMIIDSQVYAMIWPIMIQYKAIRVFLTQFHNGSMFYTGQSIQRMTVSHEVLYDSRVLASVKRNNDNVLVSELDHRILTDIKKGDYYWVHNVDELRGDQFKEVIADWMDVYGTKSMYVFRICDKKNHETVATLSLHFNFTDGLSDIGIGQLMELKKQIEAIFDKL